MNNFFMMDSINTQGRSSVGLEDSVGEFFYIDIEKLIPFKEQARKNFNDIDELATSISNYGVRQPITVINSTDSNGMFEIVSGERRVRAAKVAGLQKVPCIILKQSDNAEIVALIENIHRSDLHPLELAKAYKGLLDNAVFKDAATLFAAMGVNDHSGYETLRLLKLPEELQQYLLENNIVARDKIRKAKKEWESGRLNISVGEVQFEERDNRTERKATIKFCLKDGAITAKLNDIEKLTTEEKLSLKDNLLKVATQLSEEIEKNTK